MDAVLGLIVRRYEEAHHRRGAGSTCVAFFTLEMTLSIGMGLPAYADSRRYLPSAALPTCLMCMGARCGVR